MQKKKKSKEDKSTKKLKIDTAISGITNAGMAEDILLHGAAGKEHMVAYEGIDHETGITLKRSLRIFLRVRSIRSIRNRISSSRPDFPQR